MRKFIGVFWNTIMQAIEKAKPSSAEAAKSAIEMSQRPKKKLRYAMFLSYQGKNYFGMQVQKDMPTIEGHLLCALRLHGIITEEESKNPFSFYFQRAARTDRAVSAVRQVFIKEWTGL